MCGNAEKINGTTPHSRRWYVQPPARKKTRAGRLAHPKIIGPLRGYPPLTPPGGKLADSKHSGISNTLNSSIQTLPPTPYHLSKIYGLLRRYKNACGVPSPGLRSYLPTTAPGPSQKKAARLRRYFPPPTPPKGGKAARLRRLFFQKRIKYDTPALRAVKGSTKKNFFFLSLDRLRRIFIVRKKKFFRLRRP
jgi:hypothetical protein